MFSVIAFLMSYRREVEAVQRAARVEAPRSSRAGANDLSSAPVARAA